MSYIQKLLVLIAAYLWASANIVAIIFHICAITCFAKGSCSLLFDKHNFQDCDFLLDYMGGRLLVLFFFGMCMLVYTAACISVLQLLPNANKKNMYNTSRYLIIIFLLICLCYQVLFVIIDSFVLNDFVLNAYKQHVSTYYYCAPDSNNNHIMPPKRTPLKISLMVNTTVSSFNILFLSCSLFISFTLKHTYLRWSSLNTCDASSEI